MINEFEIPDFQKALCHISAAYVNVKRSNGDPTYKHSIRVYEMVKELWPEDTDAHVAAVLHDVVEDSYLTHEFLEQHYPKSITDIVALLTREKGERYDLYLRRLLESQNVSAVRVKFCDALDNSSHGIGSVLAGQVPFKTWVYWRVKYRKLVGMLGRYLTGVPIGHRLSGEVARALDAAHYTWVRLIDIDAIRVIRDGKSVDRHTSDAVRNNVIASKENPQNSEDVWYVIPWGGSAEEAMGAPSKNGKSATGHYLSTLFQSVEDDLNKGILKLNTPSE